LKFQPDLPILRTATSVLKHRCFVALDGLHGLDALADRQAWPFLERRQNLIPGPLALVVLPIAFASLARVVHHLTHGRIAECPDLLLVLVGQSLDVCGFQIPAGLQIIVDIVDRFLGRLRL
jgi:hypothetical protein